MQADAAPHQTADVPPPAAIAEEDVSEEETEVSKHLHITLKRILLGHSCELLVSKSVSV